MAQTETLRSTEPRTGATGSPSEPVGLDISIRTGSGSGRTLLSAFDHALQSAGVADFNLVTLSSVIPPGSRLRHVSNTLPGGHGDLLFCVRAEAYAEHSGDIAWAGLGWCVDETGGGLFVEHHGGSEESVVEQIELSLGDMNAKRGGGYGPVQMAVASAHSTGLPACAVVVAAYRVSSWHEDRPTTSESPTVAEPTPATTPHPAVANGRNHGVHVPYAAEPRPPATAGQPSANGARPEAPTSGPIDVTPEVPLLADIRVTVEKELDFATAHRYYALYREAFGPMETRAVARQLLHESEFIEEMLDPRVLKYVAWNADDEAIGMTTLTSHLETVPWISPAYFAHHYPEQYARGAVYYLGFTLVHPGYQRGHVFHAMVEPMAELVIDQRPVVAWDLCMVNDELGLGGSVSRLLSSFADFTIVQIDQQTYYAGSFDGPRHNPTR